MRIRPERRYKNFLELDLDPLRRCRKFADSVINSPELDVDEIRRRMPDPELYPEGYAAAFNVEDAVAFGRVARMLAGLKSEDNPVFDVMRDNALRFLTTAAETFEAPIVETDQGQVIQVGRDRRGKVRSVTVMRDDVRTITSSDMRFSFRAATTIDAETRISLSSVNQFNLGSPDESVVERAEEATRYVENLTGDDMYRRAADLYLEAKLAGLPSTRTLIMEQMYVSYNYAGVLVKRAREKGYLPSIEDEKGERA